MKPLRTLGLCALMTLPSILLVSCNYDDIPSVDDAADVRSLPAGTSAIKARRLSDKDIPSLVRLSDTVVTIRFGPGSGSYDSRITDEGLKALANIPWKRLNDLGLDQCDLITDSGLQHLAKIKSLRILSLEGCDNITDAGLDALASMVWLEYVGLSNVSRISSARVEKLRIQLPDTSVSTEGYLKRPKPYRHGSCDNSTNVPR